MRKRPESLRQSCLKKTMFYVSTDDIKLPDSKIPTEISDDLFLAGRETLKMKLPFVLPKCDSFDLSKLDLRTYIPGPLIIEFSQSQHHLESLCLGSKPHKPWFNTGGKSVEFNVARLIEEMINEDSRETMKHLHLEVERWKSDDWPIQVSQLLPNLTSLTIRRINVSSDAFDMICNSFPNLLSLEVSSARSPTLNGISKLEHLENLVLQNFATRNIDPWLDIFKLKNLKHLDISRHVPYNLCTDGERFTAALLDAPSLPPLETIDFIKTQIDFEMFRTVVRVFPTLTKVICCCTPIQDNPALRDLVQRPIKILNTSTLGSTLECMAYCRQKNKVDAVSQIMERALEFLKENYGTFSTRGQLLALSQEVQEMMKWDKDKDIQKIGGLILLELAQTECLKTEPSVICAVFYLYFSINSKKRLSEDFVKSFWWALDEYDLADSVFTPIKEVCEHGLEKLDELLHETVKNPILIRNIMKVLYKLVPKMRRPQELCNNPKNFSILVLLLNEYWKGEGGWNLRLSAELTAFFAKKCTMASLESEEVSTLLDIIYDTADCPDTQISLLVVLRNVSQMMGFECLEVFFTDKILESLHTLLLPGPRVQVAVNGRYLAAEVSYLTINIASIVLSVADQRLSEKEILTKINTSIKNALKKLPTTTYWAPSGGFLRYQRLMQIVESSMVDGPPEFVQWTIKHFSRPRN